MPLRIAIFLLAALVASAKLPEGEGKKIVETACTSCHTTDVVTDKQWDQAKWSDMVQSMKVRGAALKDDDIPRLVAYLTKNFSPQDRGKELVEGICILCHELDRVRSQTYTKEQWEGTIKGMIAEGAPVTDEEFSQIVNYLTKNYGPREAER